MNHPCPSCRHPRGFRHVRWTDISSPEALDARPLPSADARSCLSYFFVVPTSQSLPNFGDPEVRAAPGIVESAGLAPWPNMGWPGLPGHSSSNANSRFDASRIRWSRARHVCRFESELGVLALTQTRTPASKHGGLPHPVFGIPSDAWFRAQDAPVEILSKRRVRFLLPASVRPWRQALRGEPQAARPFCCIEPGTPTAYQLRRG